METYTRCLAAKKKDLYLRKVRKCDDDDDSFIQEDAGNKITFAYNSPRSYVAFATSTSLLIEDDKEVLLMKEFVIRMVKFYAVGLVISMLACWGASWAVFQILDLFDAMNIGRNIWFEAGLAAVEVLTCMIAMEQIRRIVVPFSMDDEDEDEDEEPTDVFDIEGL